MNLRPFIAVLCVLLPAAARSQDSTHPASVLVSASPGALFILRQSHFANAVVQTFPIGARECAASPGFLVRSGWLVLREGWWVAVDSIATCEGAPPHYHLDVRVDSGGTGGALDGSGLELLRDRKSPLPGPAAILRFTSPSRLMRVSDTIVVIGADTSQTLVYVYAGAAGKAPR